MIKCVPLYGLFFCGDDGSLLCVLFCVILYELFLMCVCDRVCPFI